MPKRSSPNCAPALNKPFLADSFLMRRRFRRPVNSNAMVLTVGLPQIGHRARGLGGAHSGPQSNVPKWSGRTPRKMTNDRF
jgi:hypothetical protein